MLPWYHSQSGGTGLEMEPRLVVCPQEQRLVEDSTREVKKVRKARNRRLEWNMMAYDKEFRPDNRFSPSPYHMASSEGSLSPDNRQVTPPPRSAHRLSFAFLFFLVFGRGRLARSRVGVISRKPVVASQTAGPLRGGILHLRSSLVVGIKSERFPFGS